MRNDCPRLTDDSRLLTADTRSQSVVLSLGGVGVKLRSPAPIQPTKQDITNQTMYLGLEDILGVLRGNDLAILAPSDRLFSPAIIEARRSNSLAGISANNGQWPFDRSTSNRLCATALISRLRLCLLFLPK